MKTTFVRTLFTFSLMLISLVTFSFNSHAAAPKIDESLSVIYKMDVVVTADKVNMREEPDLNSKVVARLKEGQHLEVIDQVGEWFYVRKGSIKGFVYYEYIMFTGEEFTDDMMANIVVHYISDRNRDINLNVACQSVNGFDLQPGESFSWDNIQIDSNSIELTDLKIPVDEEPVEQVKTAIILAILSNDIYPDLEGFTNCEEYALEFEVCSYKSVVFVNIYSIEADNPQNNKGNQNFWFL